MLTPERLRSGLKVAVPLPALRAILSLAIESTPFDPEFYKRAYPDLSDAYNSGQITDLQRHFLETGYFEGRLGANPDFDEVFYKKSYPDVVEALATGKVTSAFEHYVGSGVFEGRHANARDAELAEVWTRLFRPDGGPTVRNGSTR
jgi:hypothetical protein